ncbi:MAG: hypothetical protein WD045_06865 [Pirellulaceae bacterium]
MFFQRISSYAPLLGLTLLLGCGGSAEPGFGQVQGKVTVDSEPAPTGTRVRFQHQEDGSAFLAIVKDGGSYNYTPPSGAPLRTGDYRISVEPITMTTITDEAGMSASQPISGAPRSYGKYSKPETSGLAVTLSNGSAEYDIAIQSK